MKVGRKYKGELLHPRHDGDSLRFSVVIVTVGDVLVREVPVQVLVMTVGSANYPLTVTYTIDDGF